MKRILCLALIFLPCIGSAQELIRSLNGFHLGQFREVSTIELRSLIQKDTFPDGFEYEIFLIEPDTSVYMIFEYAPNDLETIWSIQLTGTKPGFDCGFKGLHLGMDSTVLDSMLGPPDLKESAGPYGNKWSYTHTNYSLEVSRQGLLAGIKLLDMSQDFFPVPDGSKVPTYQEYTEVLSSKDNQLISTFLAPGLEIYYEDSVYYFQKSLQTEIESDESEIFSLIDKLNVVIEQTNQADTLQFGESLRVTDEKEVMPVAKFWQNGRYSEIVFKRFFGQYLIWEIKIEEAIRRE